MQGQRGVTGMAGTELFEQAHGALLLSGGGVEGLDALQQRGGATMPEPAQPDAPRYSAPAVLDEPVARGDSSASIRSASAARPGSASLIAAS
jgi:hypothetical protein